MVIRVMRYGYLQKSKRPQSIIRKKNTEFLLFYAFQSDIAMPIRSKIQSNSREEEKKMMILEMRTNPGTDKNFLS